MIRVQVRLARMEEGDEGWEELRARAIAVYNPHVAAWRSELPALPGISWREFERGFVASVGWFFFVVVSGAFNNTAATPSP